MRKYLRPDVLLILFTLIILLFAYGGVTSLPLYMDDVIFGRYIEGVTLGELFTRIDLVPYYRPLSNAPWKLIMLMNGGQHDPAAFHSLNLIVHGLNGLLVALLAHKIITRADQPTRQRRIIATLAALLYLLFPFSYQAVGWAAALGHVMATFGALLAANGVLRWMQDKKGRNDGRAIARPYDVAMIWVGSAIAIFSHENGAATPFLVVMLVVLSSQFSVLGSRFSDHSSRAAAKLDGMQNLRTENREPRTKFPALILLVPFLILALYVAIWWVLPKARPNGIAVSPADWIANAAYFAQGIGYPVAQVGAWVWKSFGLPREAVAAALGVGGALLALLLAGKAGRVGVLWYAIAISVPTLLLQRAYAIDGPRLMMLASPGAALLWAAVVRRLVFNAETQRNRGTEGREGNFIQEGVRGREGEAGSRNAVGQFVGRQYGMVVLRLVGVSLAALIILSSSTFVGQRMGLHRKMSQAYSQLFPYRWTGAGRLFVNLPAWMAYRDEWYAIGSEGVTYMTDYIGLRDLVYVNTGEWHEVEYASYPPAFPDLPQYWWDALRADRSAEEIAEQIRALEYGVVTRYENESWLWETASTDVRIRERQNHAFVNDLTLLYASIGTNKNELFRSQPRYSINLMWRAESLITPVSAFVHIVCDGELVAQADGSPLRGILSFSNFEVGETWWESRSVWLSGSAINCAMRVGLYDPMTGERVPLTDGSEYVEVNFFE